MVSTKAVERKSVGIQVERAPRASNIDLGIGSEFITLET